MNSPRLLPYLLSHHEVETLFGNFTFLDQADGTIRQDPSWVRRHITPFVPSLRSLRWGRLLCHRRIKPTLTEAFVTIRALELEHLIDLKDTLRRGGCYFPRHIQWDCNAPLSRHSWGIAIDINPSTNRVGTRGAIDSRIVRIFEDHGFIWGGRWETPDPMHFEWARPSDPLPQAQKTG